MTKRIGLNWLYYYRITRTKIDEGKRFRLFLGIMKACFVATMRALSIGLTDEISAAAMMVHVVSVYLVVEEVVLVGDVDRANGRRHSYLRRHGRSVVLMFAMCLEYCNVAK
jgi:hypothetical protein